MVQHHPDSLDGLPFFGLDGASGAYLLSPRAAELSAEAQAEQLQPEHVRDVQGRAQAARTLGTSDNVEDPSDLAQAGWGVVFADDVDPAIKDALSELLHHRSEQARARCADYFQEFSGERGYHAGETKRAFLTSRGAAPFGPANPDELPYYLLLVGGPETIPYSLQYQLDVQYAVGRICFDTPRDYAQYAQSVVAAERANPRPRRAALVGPANANDRPTQMSATQLVQPLAEHLRDWQATQPEAQRWTVQSTVGAEATKARFGSLLGGNDTPALFFSASHGMGFQTGDPRQERIQGALVTQDWPGPQGWQRELPADFYLSADDIADDAQLHGLIAFHFACFGAGTPRLEDYQTLDLTNLRERLARSMAKRAFVAQLPRRLLGHPGGGALAVIGHVERALGSSFQFNSRGGQRSSVTTFESGLRRLMRGQPVGLAVEAFNERYADVCADLTEAVRRVNDEGRIPDDAELAELWMASTDARGYIVLGDPAVRLTGLGEGR
jgi:hypothetical protein